MAIYIYCFIAKIIAFISKFCFIETIKTYSIYITFMAIYIYCFITKNTAIISCIYFIETIKTISFSITFMAISIYCFIAKNTAIISCIYAIFACCIGIFAIARNITFSRVPWTIIAFLGAINTKK